MLPRLNRLESLAVTLSRMLQINRINACADDVTCPPIRAFRNSHAHKNFIYLGK